MALTRATDKIIGNSDGNLNLSGIVTASSFSGPLVPSGDVNVGNNIKLGAASGIVTATSFSGDGSNLTSLPAGLGTALSSTQTSPLNKLYYTNRVLSIDSTTTVDHPATGTGAYTQYAEIQIEDSADLIIEDGDDLIPDILGLGDNGTTGAGGNGRLRIDTITNKSANGAPNFPNGLTGTTGTFSGNLNVGGVLTYEDVTNVDSVGVITARSTIDAQGDVSVADKIIHTGDTNTAIRFPSADTITAETGGTEKLRINEHGLSIKNSTNTSALCVNNVRGTASAPSFNETNSDGLLVDVYNTGNPYPRYVSLAARGYGSATAQMGFWTDSGSSVAERLIISPDGYVTKPNHPSFHARLINNTNADANPLYFDGVFVNVGSHYKTSGSDQGKFVVPVAGTYFFFWEAIKNNINGSVARLYIMKNGSKTYNNMHLRLQEDGSYANGCMNVIMTLAVGDKIHINLDDGGVHGSEYTHFGGYLIG